MPLPQDKQILLYKMIVEGDSMPEINHWLINHCKLDFKEACQERYKAIEWLKTNKYDGQTTTYKEVTEDWREKKVKEEASQSTSAPINNDAEVRTEEIRGEEEEIGSRKSFEEQIEESNIVIPQEPLQETNCLTCGKEGFDCFCKIKKVKDIPW
jgi:hypothetical protein